MKSENKYYLVYKTTNLINGKFYIGVHETYNFNDGYLGSGKVLRNSVYYHGKENFKREILEFCNNKKDMYDKEKELVNEELLKNPKCMNLVIGGVGFINDKKHLEISIYANKKRNLMLNTDENFKKNLSKKLSKSAKINHKKGKYLNLRHDYFTNKKHTEETKKKMSESSKGMGIGEKNSQFGTCWITKNSINKKIKKEELTLYLNDNWIKGRFL